MDYWTEVLGQSLSHLGPELTALGAFAAVGSFYIAATRRPQPTINVNMYQSNFRF